MVRLRAPKPVILLRPLGVDTAPSTSRGARAGGARQGWRLGQGGKATTGAKEQTVVAAVARTDTVSAGPRSAQAGEYRIRLPPLCGSQRMPAGLSGHREAANPGCRFVRRRTPAKASVRRWECPRSESNRHAFKGGGFSSHFDFHRPAGRSRAGSWAGARLHHSLGAVGARRLLSTPSPHHAGLGSA